MKRTLVIHPNDPTTDCLSVIYEGKEDWEVIRNPNTSREEVEKAIRRADRVIMLGHGTPEGLLAGGARGRFDHYIIDDSFTRLLAEKETYSIWCNSNAFFEDRGMKGFHTGMILSEVAEEYFILGGAPLNKDEMAENMKLFCGTCAKYIDLEPEEMKEKVLEEYVGSDPVTMYNRDNIIIL